MKNSHKIFLLGLLIIFLPNKHSQAQSICNPEGNLFIFSNYDGGILNIDLDVNIPDIKIGIVSYEAVEINLTGDYVGNVTSVVYAGINSGNDNCGSGVVATSINGVDDSIAEILYAPEGTITEENGYPSIICGYSCGTEWQGGCNTSNEILNYFTTTLGGTVNIFKIQYECWQNDILVSEVVGTCCEEFQSPPTAEIGVIASSICIGECINYSDLSGSLPTSWAWDFEGAETTGSSIQNPEGICYLTEGTFITSLTVQNEYGTDIASLEITVSNAEIGNAEITEDGNTLVASPEGLTYQWYSCGGSFNEIFGATNQTFTPSANGLYAVVVSNNGCRDTSDCTGFILTSFEDENKIEGVTIYPNPFKDGFFFADTKSNFKNGELKLFNAVGETISINRINTDKIFIHTQKLAVGVYFIEVKNNDHNGFYKIVKE
jgi:PKD repeat protein